MFKTSININEQNAVLDHGGYFAFSSKYKTHYRKLVDPQNKSSLVTFLSGPGGTGKTSTLRAEFLNPLQSAQILHHHFNFIPDKILDNHFFLKPIANYLLSATHDKDLVHDLKDFISHYEQFEKDQPFNASEINQKFIKFVYKFTQRNALVLIFEDVHLAKSNFYDFLEQIERVQNEISLNIICTTRLGKSAHGISPGLCQKWFQLDCMSEQVMIKYLNFLTQKKQPPVYISPNLYSQSGGNPFYVKEFFYFNRQKSEFSREIHAPYHPKSNEGKGAITSFRFYSLVKNEQTALKLLCLLGYYVDQSEAVEILSRYDIDAIPVIKSLQNEGFIRNFKNILSFQHHLYYETIKNEISVLESLEIQKFIFAFLYKERSSINIERLIHHADQANLKIYACILSKKLADELHKSAHYEPAAYYYNIYLENINDCSSPQKLPKRTIQALLPLHAISFILGDHLTEEKISNYLLGITRDSDPLTRYNIDATLTVSYWTTGHIQKAHQFAKRNIQNAIDINDRRLIIAAKARYGSLSSEIADFKNAIATYNEVLSMFTSDEWHDKFDMLIEGSAVVTGIGSICYYESGDFMQARQLAERAYNVFDESSDDFTCLHISAHAGYTMVMLGKYDAALPYLEKGLAMASKNKATLIAAPALALSGLCHLYDGNITVGESRIEKSLSVMEKTFKGSKKGIINLAWMESLLIGFRTEEFSENIDSVIEETKRMSQFSHLGWLYFLKAVYHAFYQSSIQGFVGAYTKASMIAENFDMKALQLSLSSLSRLESTGILLMVEDKPLPPGFFDKAQYFYDHTSNVKPISFHIQTGTRS